MQNAQKQTIITDGTKSEARDTGNKAQPHHSHTQRGMIEETARAKTMTQSRWERARLFSIKNVLPLGFLVVLVWALAWPAPGKAVAKPKVEDYRLIQTINVVVIFIISGLTLRTDDIKKALSREGRWGYIYGVVAILGVTGCVGFLAAEIPFDVKEFSYGLAVFCVVPTTLSSGVTLVMNVSEILILYKVVGPLVHPCVPRVVT